MNKREYDTIAKIIKICKDNKPLVNPEKYIAIQLANYFETNEHIVGQVNGKPIFKKLFEKEQFLKDCGVI